MTERRQKMLAATADLRAEWQDTQARLRAVRAEIDEIRYPCPRLTRLGDAEFDLTASLKSLAGRMNAAAAAAFT